MTRQDWQLMAVWWAFLLVASLVIVSPVLAGTWGDDFSAKNISAYNYTSTRTGWDLTNGNINTTGADADYYFVSANSYFSDGRFSIDVVQNNTINGNAQMVVLLFHQAVPYKNNYLFTTGNKYGIYLYNDSTNNFIQIFRTVAGTSAYYSAVSGLNWRFWKLTNLSAIRQNNTIYGYFDGLQVTSANDATYQGGYPGFSGYQPPNNGKTIWDNFFVNESTRTNFACNPLVGSTPMAVTCNQTGVNFGDPGVSTFWMMSDGSTESTPNVTHTVQSAGTYAVGLLNQNVAGSSSEIKKNYLSYTAAATATRLPDLPAKPFKEKITDYLLSWLQ